jgi:thymidylate synthase ThyX
MYSSNLPEINKLAIEMHTELAKIIPSFVKRANDKYGVAMQNYWKECQRSTKEAADKIMEKRKKMQANSSGSEVELIEFDPQAEQKICAAILFSKTQMDYKACKKVAQEMPEEEILELLSAYVGKRENRRHKPGRAFEHVHYTFAICANFGQFRDLQRHRMLTQQRQLLTCNLGYDIPEELKKAGLASEFEDAMKKAKEAYDLLAVSKGLELAQYCVPMAYKLRWYFHLNLREAFHLIELRSMPQGHEDYRRVAVKMADEISRVHPRLASFMKFVNRENVALERLESEKRIDQKLAKMAKKE